VARLYDIGAEICQSLLHLLLAEAFVEGFRELLDDRRGVPLGVNTA
jgi:hypothetical protein